MNIRKTLFCFLLAVAGQPLYAQRDTVNIVDWQFSRSNLTPISATKAEGQWKNVRLPHDFQVEQPWVAPAKGEKADNKNEAANVKSRLSARGFKEMGIGWYRRTFTPDPSWKGRRVDLEIGGIMLIGDVYLNGTRIGGTEYGYIGFGIDVSKLLKYGQENTLVVKADTRKPNNSRWYTGAGLYRDVKFIVTDRRLYFDRHPLYITSTVPTSAITWTGGKRSVVDRSAVSPIATSAALHLQATICNYTKMNNLRVAVRIRDAKGNVIAEANDTVSFNRRMKSNECKLNDIKLTNAHLWDVVSPYLYTAEAVVYDEKGNVADRVYDTFGVRRIEYGPQFGFKLNGRKVLLKGNANHHTLGALGAAAYPRAIEKRIKLLKSFGFNHIRCSHNPYSEDLYKLCDKYGMLVVDEAYDKWTTQFGGGRAPWTSHWQYDIPEWVQRDRNHPSVVLWSLGNELQQEAKLPFGDWGVTPYRLLKTLVHRYDSTRLTTVAMHPRFRNWETDSLPCDLAMITDIQAYNYRYMYFPGDSKRFPWMIFYQSEANLPMMGPNFFDMNLKKVIGLAYWGMIDYVGESLGWPKKGWHNGVFDLSLQPKPRAWLLKSMFTDEPTVHIGIVDGRTKDEEWNGVHFGADDMSDHWNRTPGKKYTIRTFTNCDKVELLLNGKSLGVKVNDTVNSKYRDQIRWDNIPYEAGTLEAVGYKDGKAVAKHVIRTAGEPKKLVITPDLKNGKGDDYWHANGLDLLHVRVTMVDKDGVRCPQASSKLTFEVSGDAEIVAVDNGDITSDEGFTPTTASTASRSLYRGSALVILRAGTKGGKVRLTVTDGSHKAESTFVCR